MIPDTPECFDSHMGLWAMHPPYLESAYDEIRSGLRTAGPPREVSQTSYQVDDGLAVISLQGPLQKGVSKYFGTSTLAARRQLRHAASSDDVKAILLYTESPGGSAAGSYELAGDVNAAAERKPLYAHVQDIGASAAYWAIAGAQRITANVPAEVGGIGTYAVVRDESKAAELNGVKIHVVSTGPSKGLGVPGTEVTPAFLEEIQESVDNLDRHFKAAVQKGRGLSAEELAAVASGRTFSADQALSLGLIDAVQSLDETVRELRAEVVPRGQARLRRAERLQQLAET